MVLLIRVNCMSPLKMTDRSCQDVLPSATAPRDETDSSERMVRRISREGRDPSLCDGHSGSNTARDSLLNLPESTRLLFEIRGGESGDTQKEEKFQKKEAERRAEESAKCEIVVLRLGGEEGPARQFSKETTAFVKKETTVAPKEWSLGGFKTSQLMSFRVSEGLSGIMNEYHQSSSVLQTLSNWTRLGFAS